MGFFKKYFGAWSRRFFCSKHFNVKIAAIWRKLVFINIFFLYIFFTKTSFMFAKAFRFFMSGTLIILRQNCRNPDFWRFIRFHVTMLYWHFRCRQKTVACNRRHELALIIVALTGTCPWRKREKEKVSILLVQTFQIWFH